MGRVESEGHGFVFFNVNSFNGDISKWNVSRVTDMSRMFFSSQLTTVTSLRGRVKRGGHEWYVLSSFNDNISKWDVS